MVKQKILGSGWVGQYSTPNLDFPCHLVICQFPDDFKIFVNGIGNIFQGFLLGISLGMATGQSRHEGCNPLFGWFQQQRCVAWFYALLPRRGCVIQPRVAAKPLPWEGETGENKPQRGCVIINPKHILRPMQCRVCAKAPGIRPENSIFYDALPVRQCIHGHSPGWTR